MPQPLDLPEQRGDDKDGQSLPYLLQPWSQWLQRASSAEVWLLPQVPLECQPFPLSPQQQAHHRLEFSCRAPSLQWCHRLALYQHQEDLHLRPSLPPYQLEEDSQGSLPPSAWGAQLFPPSVEPCQQPPEEL